MGQTEENALTNGWMREWIAGREMGGHGWRAMDGWLEINKEEQIIIFIYVDTQCLFYVCLHNVYAKIFGLP